jgi:hypothetical protein
MEFVELRAAALVAGDHAMQAAARRLGKLVAVCRSPKNALNRIFLTFM